jgi:membrane protein DedA with SNARE-associated domain
MLKDFDQFGYVGVFAALIAAGFGFPIPEELPVLTAGVLVGHEDTTLHWYIMLPVVIVGVVTGDGILYAVGRLWGHRLLSLKWVQRRILPPEKRIEIEKNFADRGIMVLLGTRLLPGIRTPIFIMAGVLRVPLKRFLLADGIYAIPLVNVLFWLAYWFTDQVLVVFNQIQLVQKEYRALVFVAILAGLAGVLISKYLVSRKVSTGEPPHVPQIISKAVDKVTGRHHTEKLDEENVPTSPSAATIEEPKTEVFYKLTDEAFADLRAANIPDSVLNKLIILKDKMLTQEGMMNEIATLLDADQAKQFQDIILHDSRMGTPQA